jgi:hypothetical protein
MNQNKFVDIVLLNSMWIEIIVKPYHLELG